MARRLLALSVTLSALVLLSLPLGATTTTSNTNETTTTASIEGGTTAATDTETTGAETGGTEVTEPAVTIEPAVTVDTTPAVVSGPDWTYRFFIPTLLALAVLVVIVTVIQYFTRVVRNRYRIVR